jgi:hypothetical protein
MPTLIFKNKTRVTENEWWIFNRNEDEFPEITARGYSQDRFRKILAPDSPNAQYYKHTPFVLMKSQKTTNTQAWSVIMMYRNYEAAYAAAMSKYATAKLKNQDVDLAQPMAGVHASMFAPAKEILTDLISRVSNGRLSVENQHAALSEITEVLEMLPLLQSARDASYERITKKLMMGVK